MADPGLETGLEVSIHFGNGAVPTISGAVCDPLPVTSVSLTPLSNDPLMVVEVGALAAVVGEQPGQLESYILSNAAYQKAKQLRADPRFDKMDQQTRANFLNEWGALLGSKAVVSRDLLIDESRPLDKEQMELFAQLNLLRDIRYRLTVEQAVLESAIEEHNKQVGEFNKKNATLGQEIGEHNRRFEALRAELEAHNRIVDAHNAEVGRFRAECTGRPLPPSQYERCIAWQQTLNQRAAQLNRETAELRRRGEANDREAAWMNQARAELDAWAERLDKEATKFREEWASLTERKRRYNEDCRKATDWSAALTDKWEFEKRRIQEWIDLLEKFNGRLEKALQAT